MPVIYYTEHNIVAVRGAWMDDGLPQTSIAALKRAIEMNCAGSEFDVWLTKDDSLVVAHDIKYAGKIIENSTYATLSKTRLFNGEILPTLRQYLSAASGQNQTKLFLEIKSMSYDQQKLNKVTDNILDLVSEMQMQDQLLYTSFVFYMLQRVHQRLPSAKTLFLGGTLSPATIKAAGISGSCYDIDTLTVHPDWLTDNSSYNIILSSWTVNDNDKYTWLLNNNTTYVISDAPNELFRVLDKIK